jgi:hypothetical protein
MDKKNSLIGKPYQYPGGYCVNTGTGEREAVPAQEMTIMTYPYKLSNRKSARFILKMVGVNGNIYRVIYKPENVRHEQPQTP